MIGHHENLFKIDLFYCSVKKNFNLQISFYPLIIDSFD